MKTNHLLQQRKENRNNILSLSDKLLLLHLRIVSWQCEWEMPNSNQYIQLNSGAEAELSNSHWNFLKWGLGYLSSRPSICNISLNPTDNIYKQNTAGWIQYKCYTLARGSSWIIFLSLFFFFSETQRVTAVSTGSYLILNRLTPQLFHQTDQTEW